MLKKLVEHTYGSHIYMKLSIDNVVYEIDVYIRENGDVYETTADKISQEKREEVIAAFNKLY